MAILRKALCLKPAVYELNALVLIQITSQAAKQLLCCELSLFVHTLKFSCKINIQCISIFLQHLATMVPHDVKTALAA